MRHPVDIARAALIVTALLLTSPLVVRPLAHAAPMGAGSCAALGTYQIDQPRVPRTLSLHRAPPAQAARIPARWFLRGQLTLTAYTGCGRPTQGAFAVQRVLVQPLHREAPTGRPPCDAGCAMETNVVSATGRIAQDPAHASDPRAVLVSGIVTTTRPGPLQGRACAQRTGCPPPGVITSTVTLGTASGSLQVRDAPQSLILTFFLPPVPGETATARAPLVLRGARVDTLAPTTQSIQWQQQTPPGAGSGASGLRRIACPSARQCVTVGEHGVILVTTDSGHTWQRRDSGTQQTLTGVACPTILVCYAVGAGAVVLTTTDSGQTWQPQRTAAPASLIGIACPAVMICAAVGDVGVVALTSDGGHTWRVRHSGTGRGLASVACPSRQVCYAVGSVGTIVATRDGGHTWQDQSLPLVVRSALATQGGSDEARQRLAAQGSRARASAGDTPLLTDVACPTVSICSASGGQVVRTTDGGHRWTVGPPQTMDGDGYFWSNGIACPLPTTCSLVGEQGRVLLTTDSGRTWSTQTTPMTQTLQSIACPSTQVCYAVGDKETIMMASDVPGGEAGGTPAPSSAATVTSTPAAAAGQGTALVAGTAMAGGFSGATPTLVPSATTVPASGRVTLGLSSRGKTVTLTRGASIMLDAGAVYALSHITYDPAVLADGGQASEGTAVLRAVGVGTTRLTATAATRCLQARPACGLPSLLLTYTVYVVSS